MCSLSPFLLSSHLAFHQSSLSFFCSSEFPLFESPTTSESSVETSGSVTDTQQNADYNGPTGEVGWDEEGVWGQWGRSGGRRDHNLRPSIAGLVSCRRRHFCLTTMKKWQLNSKDQNYARCKTKRSRGHEGTSTDKHRFAAEKKQEKCKGAERWFEWESRRFLVLLPDE